MTEFSADRVGVHGTSALRMSRCGMLTEGAYIFRALEVDVFGGLTLETLDDGGSCGRSVGDGDGVVACSRLHNHLQSSGEHNTSSAHSRSTLLDRPPPASLSQCSVMMILFPCGKGRCGS